MARVLPYSFIRFILQGQCSQDNIQWQCEFDYAASGDVVPAARSAEVLAFSNAIVAFVFTDVMAALAVKTSVDRSITQIVDQLGTVENVINTVSWGVPGTYPTTGNDLPSAVASAAARRDGLSGRKHIGRVFWPLGESAMLDATDANKLSGAMHSSINTMLSDFLSPLLPLALTWTPCLWHSDGTTSPLSQFAAELRSVTWRRSRKYGVGN